ncbi:MAG: response regulator [Kofleriaceae bacterium]|nr:response regulator [Myxococcales bacterium]MCB9572156.1 response regulator [Kofleriaceae bacterium]
MTPTSSTDASGGAAANRGPAPLRVAIFDDVVAARAEHFHIPGLAVDVYAHADDAVARCAPPGGADRYDVVLMDFAMGRGRKTGQAACVELRAAGFRGRIVAISSDPAANSAMRAAGADESLAAKAHLRSYLVHLGGRHLRPGTPAAGAR